MAVVMGGYSVHMEGSAERLEKSGVKLGSVHALPVNMQL